MYKIIEYKDHTLDVCALINFYYMKQINKCFDLKFGSFSIQLNQTHIKDRNITKFANIRRFCIVRGANKS